MTLAVVSALKQISMGGSGVPMIDEEGRPRPVKVHVMAETRVQGCRNVVGERAVLGAVVGGGLAMGAKRKPAAEEDARDGKKRERAGSEPVQSQGEGKRLRTE